MASQDISPFDYIDLTTDDDTSINETTTLLLNVQEALNSHVNEAVFAVGGTIPLTTEQTIDIRWDHEGSVHKTNFPIISSNEDSSRARAFEDLLSTCEPATFGKGKVDVLDVEYRNASVLDERQFSTSFNPAAYEILDTVTRVLVQERWDHGSVRAELYKLNIYSGPSGKFKSHVDTPRGTDQIGSLVVCLPCKFKGGGLAVRHGGKEVTFDWASKGAATIQWAALFSDCEHEVLQVTEGDRVTLTYNLFLSAGGPRGLGIFEPEKLHFFAALEELMRCPSFFPQGGFLGFNCTHIYPHTANSIEPARLNCMMKGVDMAVFQAFTRLCSTVQCEAVVHNNDSDRSDVSYNGSEGYYDGTENDYACDSDDSDESSLRQYINAMADTADQDNDLSTISFVSQGGAPSVFLKNHQEEGRKFEQTIWGSGYQRRKITWLNGEPVRKGEGEELAGAWIAYGNQADLKYCYSKAAIVAKVESWEERMKG